MDGVNPNAVMSTRAEEGWSLRGRRAHGDVVRSPSTNSVALGDESGTAAYAGGFLVVELSGRKGKFRSFAVTEDSLSLDEPRLHGSFAICISRPPVRCIIQSKV